MGFEAGRDGRQSRITRSFVRSLGELAKSLTLGVWGRPGRCWDKYEDSERAESRCCLPRWQLTIPFIPLRNYILHITYHPSPIVAGCPIRRSD